MKYIYVYSVAVSQIPYAKRSERTADMLFHSITLGATRSTMNCDVRARLSADSRF